MPVNGDRADALVEDLEFRAHVIAKHDAVRTPAVHPMSRPRVLGLIYQYLRILMESFSNTNGAWSSPRSKMILMSGTDIVRSRQLKDLWPFVASKLMSISALNLNLSLSDILRPGTLNLRGLISTSYNYS